MHAEVPEPQRAAEDIERAERRVAERQTMLDNLKRGSSGSLPSSLMKTFEEDLAASRAKLARLKP